MDEKKKKFSPFDQCSWFVCLRRRNKPKQFPSVWLYVRTWTFHVDTITFEGVSGSKQNLVGVFYVWNVGLVMKSKVKSWFWSKSWSGTEFWFSQKLCGATLGMCTNPRYFELFVSGSKYQHSNLFKLVRSRFEQCGQFGQFRQFRPFTPFETTKSLIMTNWKF